MKNIDFHVQNDRQLNHIYDIERKLGEGCFGVVYKAINRQHNRPCAIKIEPLKQKSKQTLKREYILLKSLKGTDGIPTVYAYCNTQSFSLIEMELLQTDMSFLIEKHVVVDVNNICKMGTQLIRILEDIHSKGIIHRDLKPQNLMLDRQSKLYIVDFGIAKKMSSSEDELTKAQSFVGTPRYASRNAHLGVQLGPQDDIESLLYILVYFIKKRLPWMNNGREGMRKLDSIKKCKLQTKFEELCQGLPECFLTAFKYIAFPRKSIDYNFLITLLKNPKQIEEIFCDFSYKCFSSILEMGLEMAKKAKQRNSRRTSLEYNPNLLHVPGQTTDLVSTDISQVVIQSNASLSQTNIEQLQEMIPPEESITQRLKSLQHRKSFAFNIN